MGCVHFARVAFQPAAAALAVAGALTPSAAGCAIDDRTLSVGDAAAPPAPVAGPIPIMPDELGGVRGANAAAIRGSWYAYADSGGCVATGRFSPDQCSAIFAPGSGPFAPSDPATGRMCTSGIAAQVIADPSTGAPAYSIIWGAGIGFNFNDRQAYDATAHMITGVSFVIDSPPPGALAIHFPSVADPDVGPTWGGAVALASPVTPGLNVIKWAELGGPFYATDPPPFDGSQLIGIQFHVLSNEHDPTPFDYCVSNFSALTE
jgi:hypothetical protein